SHPKVTKVIYPSLMEGEPRRRADAYMKGGYGGLLGFELKGGKDAGRRFIDALQMLYHVANIGDARSLAIHPASTTHSQLTPEEQLQTGVTPSPRPAPPRGARGKAEESVLSFAWPIDLALTVASHGWAYLAPWAWDPERGLLARVEQIGGRIGTVAVSQSDPHSVSVCYDGFADGDEPEILRRAARWVSAEWDPAAAIAALGNGFADDARLIAAGGGRLLRCSTFYE